MRNLNPLTAGLSLPSTCGSIWESIHLMLYEGGSFGGVIAFHSYVATGAAAFVLHNERGLHGTPQQGRQPISSPAVTMLFVRLNFP